MKKDGVTFANKKAQKLLVCYLFFSKKKKKILLNLKYVYI